MTDDNTYVYEIKDMYLASFLRSRGVDFYDTKEGVGKGGRGIIMFLFKDSAEFKTLYREYYNSKNESYFNVNINKFVHELNILKSYLDNFAVKRNLK